jgi:quercetin dioxygenase-like cupin family protein
VSGGTSPLEEEIEMNLTRRSVCLLVPALAARAPAADQASLPTIIKRFEELKVNASSENRYRPILEGTTHKGFQIEAHQTELAPGSMPHAAHRHLHEEMFLIREGAVEVTVNGKGTRLGPGGVAYVASSEEHGIKNVGTTTAQYFVIALGKN